MPDEPHLTWKLAAIVLWASAVSGWLVAAGTLHALDRLRRTPQRATEASPVPFSPRSVP